MTYPTRVSGSVSAAASFAPPFRTIAGQPLGRSTVAAQGREEIRSGILTLHHAIATGGLGRIESVVGLGHECGRFVPTFEFRNTGGDGDLSDSLCTAAARTRARSTPTRIRSAIATAAPRDTPGMIAANSSPPYRAAR